MKKKKKSYNLRLIKSKRLYTLKEISELYQIHIRTAQEWRKMGLKSLDDKTSPILIYGMDLRNFLKYRQDKRKQSLGTDEFYCTKCKKPRKSIPDYIDFVNTNKRLGNNSMQIRIKGKCEVCNSILNRFSSTQKVKNFQKKDVKKPEQMKLLYGTESCSINTDLKEVSKNVKNKQYK